MRNTPKTCTVAPSAESATLTDADTSLIASLRPSPNRGDRRGRGIDALILHYTGMDSGEAALARLCDPASEVSCHYLVWESGRIDQLVAETDRAWHAGRSFWAGETDMNSVSIGIEIVNGGHDGGLPPFPPAQVAAVSALCRDVSRRRAIPRRRVLAHSDIAPGRKLDPGERFPWRDLAEAGVGLWVDPEPVVAGGALALGDEGVAVSELQHALAALGFRCPMTGRFDLALRDNVAAFQRHWRPSQVDGRADTSTLATLRMLLAAKAMDAALSM